MSHRHLMLQVSNECIIDTSGFYLPQQIDVFILRCWKLFFNHTALFILHPV